MAHTDLNYVAHVCKTFKDMYTIIPSESALQYRERWEAEFTIFRIQMELLSENMFNSSTLFDSAFMDATVIYNKGANYEISYKKAYAETEKGKTWSTILTEFGLHTITWALPGKLIGAAVGSAVGAAPVVALGVGSTLMWNAYQTRFVIPIIQKNRLTLIDRFNSSTTTMRTVMNFWKARHETVREIILKTKEIARNINNYDTTANVKFLNAINTQLHTLVESHKHYVGIPQGGVLESKINTILELPKTKQLPSST